MASVVSSLRREPLPGKYLVPLEFPMRDELEARVEALSAYLPGLQQRFIREKIFPFTCYWHRDQVRKSGEPYVVHPVAVAEILAFYKVDVNTLAAAIMHDVYEDNEGKLTLEEIERYFGLDIRNLVDGLTKIGIASARNRRQIAEIKATMQEELQDTIANATLFQRLSGAPAGTGEGLDAQTQADMRARQAKIDDKNASLAKLLVGIADDPRIILIKLADRLHNMRTLHSLRPDKQKRIARETLDFFCPIADRFGLWEMKTELEELCFRYLNPPLYQGIKDKISKVRLSRQEDYYRTIEQLKIYLEEEHISAQLQLLEAGVYSIFRKMERQATTSVEDVYDLNSLQIIVPSAALCYQVEGVIKRHYQSYTAKYRDYIAIPKSNSYRAIHLTFLGAGRRIIEARISSQSDHRSNTIGVFTEFGSGMGDWEGQGVRQIIGAKWAPWIKSLRALHDVAADDKDFLDWVLDGPLGYSITCFTPHGDAKELPAGSTPLDFAFAVHTHLGLHCSGALVNGRSVSCLEYALKENDFVQILTSEEVMPLRNWYDACRTPKAKSALSNWYRDNYSLESNRAYGLKLLTASLIKAGLAGLQNNQQFLTELARRCNCANQREMLISLGTRRLSGKVASEHFAECARAAGWRAMPGGGAAQQDISSLIHVPRFDTFQIYACAECGPVVGDEVMVIGDRPGSLILHRRNCRVAQKIMQREVLNAAVQDTLMPGNTSDLQRDLEPTLIHETAEWLAGAQAKGLGLRTKINLKAICRFELTGEIMLCCRDRQMEIYDYRLSNNFQGEASTVSMVVGAESLRDLQSLLQELRHIEGVVQVER